MFLIYCIFVAKMQYFNIFSYIFTPFCNKSNYVKLEDFYNIKKFNYSKLRKTNIHNLTRKSFRVKNKIFPLKFFYANENYLKALSKFINLKINNSKITYRSINSITMIECLASRLVEELIKTNKTYVFKNYKTLNKILKLKQKEHKVFKIVLARTLLEKVIKIKHNLDIIDKIIIKSKNAKSIRFYRNSTYFNAQIYSILHYNNNSSKVLYKLKTPTDDHIKTFFTYLFQQTHLVNIIINYLVIIFY